MENFSWLTFMDAVPEKDEFLALKKELTKLRLEAKLRKSLSAELTRQKSIADTAKADALSKSRQLAELSAKLAKYLSPQIYEQIFSGEHNAEVKSYRKKLTIFFSDLVGFSTISDELESEDLTNMLNFYLDEMSKIALKHGGTIDKFIGDSVMIFFGDPQSHGAEKDAKNCILMAIEMQNKMRDLEGHWGRHFSFRDNLQMRIGINTGFCTVGNFGSNDRIDYTVVGGAVNLASRLETAAKAGSILVSEETFLLVNDEFNFNKPVRLNVKGLQRELKAYELSMKKSAKSNFTNYKRKGFNLRIDIDSIDQSEIEELKKIIKKLE